MFQNHQDEAARAPLTVVGACGVTKVSGDPRSGPTVSMAVEAGLEVVARALAGHRDVANDADRAPC
ncbi:MAG TPA: hypothetical protein DHU96_28210 [Actinobacteria bacterium]|nr:hypothetical protein [Actinomycetota bacterium]